MYTPAAIQKILVDFGVCVDDQSAWAVISSPLDNDETITINCSIGDDVRLYGDDDPQWDTLGPGVAGYSVVVEDENCVVVPRVLTVEEASLVDDVVDWLDSLYAEAYVSKEYDY